MFPDSFSSQPRSLVTFFVALLLLVACDSALHGEFSGAKDVIDSSLKIAVFIAKASLSRFENLRNRADLSSRSKGSINDCVMMMDELLSELEMAKKEIRRYKPEKGAMSEEAACNLKILLSGVMTNYETCMGGLSGVEAVDVKEEVVGGSEKFLHMVSKSLAMVKNMTGDSGDDGGEGMGNIGNRRLLGFARSAADGFPLWMTAGDRKLLQTKNVGSADVVVAADGSGNFKTVTEAVNRAPEGSNKRYIIQIKAGVYRENVDINRKKTNLMFIGAGQGVTIITGSRSNAGGSSTFSSATVGISGDRFIARDITFQNTAGPSGGQAVALRVGSDFSAFYRCEISGYQDTLYALELRQFYRDCTISGTVDFIFGNAAAIFQNCNINARKPNPGQGNAITAQSRSDPNQNTGYVIINSRVDGTSDLVGARGSVTTVLGRPWREYSRVVVMQTYLGSIIHPDGWGQWVGTAGLNTLYYAEYMNTGPGASTEKRVKWMGYKGVISAGEANKFTAGNFIQGSNWLGSTGFPYSLGL